MHVTRLTFSKMFIENWPLLDCLLKIDIQTYVIYFVHKMTVPNKFIHVNVKTHFSNASFNYYTEYNYLQFDENRFRFTLKNQSIFLVKSDIENVAKPISIFTYLTWNNEMARKSIGRHPNKHFR